MSAARYFTAVIIIQAASHSSFYPPTHTRLSTISQIRTAKKTNLSLQLFFFLSTYFFVFTRWMTIRSASRSNPPAAQQDFSFPPSSTPGRQQNQYLDDIESSNDRRLMENKVLLL